METSPVRRWPRADLRVGDADRQRVVDELQRHYVAGRLNSEELGERVAAALGARTFGDLSVVLDDLPAEPGAGVAADRARSFVGPPLGLLLVIVGVVAFVVLMLGGQLWHGSPIFFWPFLWVFFFIGWPRGGRRRHF